MLGFCKTVVTPLLKHWSSSSLALSHQCFEDSLFLLYSQENSARPRWVDIFCGALFLDAATFRFGDLYNREDSSSDAVLHCTAFFAGSGRAPGCKDYSSRIQDSVGKVFKLCVIGVVVTPRTVGLRIRLSSEQLELWGKDDYDGYESSSPHHCEMVCQYHHGQAHSQFHPTCGYGSRAHVTLGYARGYGAVQAGHDQMDVLNCEVDSFDDHNHVVIPEGALKYYGEGKCVVYLNKPLEYRTLFGGRYTGN